MKKKFVLFLALILALSLAACGGNNTSPPSGDTAPPSGDTASPADDTAPPSGNDDFPEGQAMASLIKWMMDGTFSYDFTMTSEGPEGKTEGSGSMAIDGNNMAYNTEMTVEGQRVKSRMIQKDGKMYMIDDENKFIMEMSVEMNITEGMMTDYADIVLVGSGMGEINGRTLPYEEYAESELGATVKYFLDGGEVYGFVSEYEGYSSTMIITNPSGSVPAGAFDLPEGYASMSDFGLDGLDLSDFDLSDFDLSDFEI